MTSHAHTLSHTALGLLGSTQREEEQGYKITALLGLLNQLDIRTGGKGGLEGEGFSILQQLDDTVNHQSASLNSHSLGVEGRDTCGNLVGIHKLPAFQHLG